MPKKILLADDSITIQKVVELTFSDGDYEVTAVNNGARAIQKLSEMRPDIILSDIIMPEKNGYEVCEYVKSHPEHRNIPVVLLTGTFEPFDPDRADKAGCDAVVTKPFESQSLIHKVEELIEQARSSASTAAAAPPPPAPEPPRQPEAEPEPQPQEASPWSDEPAGSPAGSAPTTEMPFSSSSSGRENLATTQQFTPPPPEPSSPWDSPAPAGETRAFPKMNFDDMQQKRSEPEPASSAPEDDSPFGAPPAAEQFSGETRAFPKMDLEQLKKLAEEGKSSPAQQEEHPPEFSGETRAFPQMNFDQLSQAASQSASLSDDDSPWGAPVAETAAEPQREAEPEPQREPEFEPQAEAPAWAPQEAPQAAAPAAATTAASSGNGVALTEEQIDKIARRVVQLMSDQVVRNIAWEVIPDMAEMVVKERIRQLESET